MKSDLSIALISRADASGGGASRVADDIWKGLQNRPGFIARRYVGELSKNNSSEINYGRILSRNLGIYRRLKRFATKAGYVDHFPLELFSLNPEIPSSKIIHAHDVSSVMAPSTLSYLSRRKKIVWTLHDMSVLTAGCIYPLGCDHWENECGACPQIGSWPLNTRKDRTRELAKRRRKILKGSNIKFVSPSQWLAKEVNRVAPNIPVKVIYNGVDISIFRAWDPLPVRERYKLPEKELTVLFIANHLAEVRKGALYIPEIVNYLSATQQHLRMVLVGNFPIMGVKRLGNLEQHFVGHISDRYQLAQLYAAVDAVLLPTHADNFPLVALETMATGTPVFAFDTGGLPEIVDSASGVIVPAGRIEMLMRSLFDIYSSGRLPEMGANASARASELFNLDKCRLAHEELYFEFALSG